MPVYNPPLRDIKFVMQEMLNVGDLMKYEKFAEADVETLDAILEQSAKFSSEVLAPLNAVGDHEGCTRNADGSVTTPTGFKEAYQQVVEGGMMGLSESPEYGGMGMPSLWSTATGEMQSSANMAFAMYPGLTGSAAKAIRIGGTELQKNTYLPKMISGEWTVPKFKLDADGNPGERNAVSCGAIEEKMGIHGNCTCVMNYDEAEGYLIGEENKGLRVMFVMMNEARMGVGMQGLGQSEVAYQNAVIYANDRLQGRSLTGPKNDNGPADPLMVHPDVRRMLMETKAFNEGSRALIYWATLLEDLENIHEDEKFREKCDDFLGLLTPVIKGYITDKAMMTTIDCQQIFGGHGFIEEWGMSQFVRDTRIALIYEGANGIQALDLVGRKLARHGGRALMTLSGEIDAFAKEHAGNENVSEFIDGLSGAKAKLTEGTMWLMQNGMTNPDNAGAGSVDYMHMMGLTSLAYMWAMMAVTAQAAIDAGSNDDFYQNKLITGRYFVLRMLPMMDAHLAKMKTGAEPVMALEASAF